MKFRITRGKGFYYGFSNGWGVSVQFGPGNYADNYDMRIGNEDSEAGANGSETAECAVITPDDKLFAHPEFDGDTVKGHGTPDEVLTLLVWAQAQAPNNQSAVSTGENMNVKAIFIEGDNVILSSVHFAGLVAESARAERLDAVALASSKVIAYDWSDNDADAVADMRALRSAVNAL